MEIKSARERKSALIKSSLTPKFDVLYTALV
jgi:hypothetical protein